MDDNESWKESKAKETIGQNLIYTILDFAGYKIFKFGIENFVEDMRKEIKNFYGTPTNCLLMCMPDYVVVDPETKKAVMIEVKYRNIKKPLKGTIDFNFKYHTINNYMKYWNDMVLIIVFNVSPFIRCIRVNEIDWNYHLVGKIYSGTIARSELWNFYGIKKEIIDIFPRVKKEHIFKAKKILNFNE